MLLLPLPGPASRVRPRRAAPGRVPSGVPACRGPAEPGSSANTAGWDPEAEQTLGKTTSGLGLLCRAHDAAGETTSPGPGPAQPSVGSGSCRMRRVTRVWWPRPTCLCGWPPGARLSGCALRGAAPSPHREPGALAFARGSAGSRLQVQGNRVWAADHASPGVPTESLHRPPRWRHSQTPPNASLVSQSGRQRPREAGWPPAGSRPRSVEADSWGQQFAERGVGGRDLGRLPADPFCRGSQCQGHAAQGALRAAHPGVPQPGWGRW